MQCTKPACRVARCERFGGIMRRNRTIPPSSPMYNVTCVQVYSATPAAVMGYVTAGVLVYGTGYYSPPVVVPGPVPIYYPYSYSYASNVWYNPSTARGHGAGRSMGLYGGAASGGRDHNPRRARTATSMRAVMATSITTTITAGRNGTTAGGIRCSSHRPTSTGVAATATSEPIMAVSDPTPSTAPAISGSSRIGSAGKPGMDSSGAEAGPAAAWGSGTNEPPRGAEASGRR